MQDDLAPLDQAARYGRAFRSRDRPIHPTASVQELRDAFCQPLADSGRPGTAVIRELIEAAEPGLVGNTDPNFFAWVMGGSDPVGVAADWLASVWGQNAAIYQTSPAAAIAEEAVSAWLLELLDLPRDSSVGFVTGATMAGFVGLSAARSEVLARAGVDFAALGLQGSPRIHVILSDDAHVCNLTALRHLGFGEANLHRLPSGPDGLAAPEVLDAAMASVDGPKIVIAQAGHINSGGFEDFTAFARIAKTHDAWLHVDGAFGLWARACPETRPLAAGAELADSWSVDGHKWLQIPYDSGFVIVKDARAHRRAMQIQAAYLNEAPEDGRNPTSYVPGLSRRARGFAAWAVLRGLGREGVAALVRRHCNAASVLAARVREIDGLTVVNRVDLNQVVVGGTDPTDASHAIARLADRLNEAHGLFVRTAVWKGQTVLRLSVISQDTTDSHAAHLADCIRTAWHDIRQDTSTRLA
ncbi:MAG: aminotransferase class V-fold PLP-dependent enzyme [Pseudomonadota bacterium]